MGSSATTLARRVPCSREERERVRSGGELETRLLADVVAVELQRKRMRSDDLEPVEVVETDDVAKVDVPPGTERAPHETQDVSQAERADAGDVDAALGIGKRRDLKEAVAQERERIRVPGDGDAKVAVLGPVGQPDRDRRLTRVVCEEIGADGGRYEVPLADRLLHAEPPLDLPDDGRVEPHAGD